MCEQKQLAADKRPPTGGTFVVEAWLEVAGETFSEWTCISREDTYEYCVGFIMGAENQCCNGAFRIKEMGVFTNSTPGWLKDRKTE